MRAHHRILAVHRVLAFVGLVLLATTSLVLATGLHWYRGDVAVSLAIAAVKTYLVLFFFMDMAEQPFRSRLAIAVAALLLLILVGLTTSDVATRMLMPRGPAPQPSDAFFER
jgi:caa(3)-type oxidase subunit IV